MMGLIGLSGTPDGLGDCGCGGLGAQPPVLRKHVPLWDDTCAHFKAVIDHCKSNPDTEQCRKIDSISKSELAAKAKECGNEGAFEASGLGKSGMPIWAWGIIGVGVLGAGYLIVTRKKGRR